MAVPEIPGFRDLELIGRGASTDVYRARKNTTGGLVAIKVFHDTVDPAAVARRANREVEALIHLKGHPNVIHIEEVVPYGSGVALVMEYAPGGSVGDLIRKQGKLDVSTTVGIALQAARALQAAHALGIVHRDIKPENLLLGSFDTIKVCDFGISYLSESVTNKARTSAISIRYASPEELDGEDVTPPSDIYSLGASLFHALVGRAPAFSDRGDLASAGERNEVPVAMRSLIEACMSVEPSRRPTAAQIVANLSPTGASLRSGIADSMPPPDPSAPLPQPRTVEDPDPRTVTIAASFLRERPHDAAQEPETAPPAAPVGSFVVIAGAALAAGGAGYLLIRFLFG